jgi:hypothetical protein
MARRPVTLNRLHQSHPLELNQDLSGFGRARRPATPEWEVRCAGLAAARSDSSLGACQHPHRHDSSIVRDRPHAQGAPRAVMRPRFARTHRSRSRRASARRGRTALVVNRWSAGVGPGPETSKGRLVFPGGPSAQMTFYIICLENLRGSPPPCPDRAGTRYRRARRRSVRSGRSWSGTSTPRRGRPGAGDSMVAGYVLAGATRGFSGSRGAAQLANSDANRTMMRRIAVSNRSVKRFFDEIHNNAWRLAFRRSG